MQYVRGIAGSVAKTYNSINPATLSGAIDVIVVEQENGDLACSPFHVRFGKFSLLRPYEKKVEFRLNGEKRDFPMKLGEGGEAFFVFETMSDIPADLQTSPLVSPAASPGPVSPISDSKTTLGEPDYLNLEDDAASKNSSDTPQVRRAQSDSGNPYHLSPPIEDPVKRPNSGDWSKFYERSVSEEVLPTTSRLIDLQSRIRSAAQDTNEELNETPRPKSPTLDPAAALQRAHTLSRKLSISNIPSHVTDNGDVMLDMHGYKMEEEDNIQAEAIAKRILSEEFEGNYDLGSLMGADQQGNLWIYASEDAKKEADRKAGIASLNAGTSSLNPSQPDTFDAESGYSSDGGRSVDVDGEPKQLATPPNTPPSTKEKMLRAAKAATSGDPNRNYAKTLRLTSNQLKSLDLKSGLNTMSFTVNRATCTANMYLWKYNVPVVISDIDGTITKSDALGHMFTMIGRDWTHLGVAKLYTDIAANGYNLIYLTSRSVGQADTTRNYLKGIVQDQYRLPPGPVIMSPDRTLAALRREVYLRKPEVFKMACLRDILNLYGDWHNPFYAGFGNRLTDALSYRSVNIPSTRIYTINSDGMVILDLLTLTSYKSSYVNMRDDVDHFFPPVTKLTTDESYTDFNYWRSTVPDPADFSDSDDDEPKRHSKYNYQHSDDEDEDDELDEEEDVEGEEEHSEDDDEEYDDDTNHLKDSFISAASGHHNPSSDDTAVEAANKKFDDLLMPSDKGVEVEELLKSDKGSLAADGLKNVYHKEHPDHLRDTGAEEIQGVEVLDPRVIEAADDYKLRLSDERDGTLSHMAEVVEGVLGYKTDDGISIDEAEAKRGL